MEPYKHPAMAKFLTEEVKAVTAAINDHDGGDFIDEIEEPLLELAKALDEYRAASASMHERTDAKLSSTGAYI